MEGQESVDRVSIGIVGLAELIAMRFPFWLVGRDLAEVLSVTADMDAAGFLVEGILALPLNPDVQVIVSFGDTGDLEDSFGIGDAIERGFEGDDDGAHLGVDVAEDVGDSFAGEDDAATGTCLVESQIESSAIEERKDVMEEGIVVGEGDAASDWND